MSHHLIVYIVYKYNNIFKDKIKAYFQQKIDILYFTNYKTREFIVMLNQSSSDGEELAKLLNISEMQMNYITNVGAGQGLIKIGNVLVPFINEFPTNTELYKLMTTKPNEKI